MTDVDCSSFCFCIMQMLAMENAKCMEMYTKYRSLLPSADRVFV